MELAELFEQECKVAVCLAQMEAYGAKIDLARLASMKAIAEKYLQIFQAKANALAGMEVDYNKAASIIKVFEAQGISLTEISKQAPGVIKSNAKKAREGKDETETSTTKEVLLLTNTELGRTIIDCKSLHKLLNTYLIPYESQCDANGRIHTEYFQNGAKTGRLSSKQPNLQNTKRDELELCQLDVTEAVKNECKQIDIRNLFVAEATFDLFKADYSQMEMRGLAYYSQEPIMIDAFLHGRDLHQETATMLTKSLGKEIPRKQKGDIGGGKEVNFSLIYGAGDTGLAGILKIDLPSAKKARTGIRNLYPKALSFMDSVRVKGKGRGWVKNLYKRHYPTPFGKEYRLVNYLIQGSCADMMKEKLVAVSQFLADKKSRLILTVHDELVFEIHNTEAHLLKTIKQIMEDFATPVEGLRAGFNVAFPVEVSYCKTGYGSGEAYET